MYLCFYTPKMKCIKYFVGIDQNNRNNRSFRPNRAFEAAGFKVTHFVFVVKLITAFRKQDIFHSIFYIFSSLFPCTRSTNSLTRMVLDLALSITREQGVGCEIIIPSASYFP